MKAILAVLLSLLSLIHNLVIEGPTCTWGWKEKGSNYYYYCEYFDGTKIKVSNEKDCLSSSTLKCSNPTYETKEECEKTFEWVEGKCYRNIKDKNSEFLYYFKDKQTCEEEKADWTMKYCSFQNFTGNIYNQIKDD